jgi:hypothetical protein
MSNLSRGGDYRYDKPVSIGEPDKVTAWPFPEPEKKSAWDEQDKAELRAEGFRAMFRDSEKESAEKRTAMIRARMSPPGALRLPPLLEGQRLKHGIPDGFFKSQASFDRIFVFPIDQFDGMETYAPKGTILRGEVKKLKDMQEGNRGVLISAGLIAADRLMGHGIELGHVITTNKNVPFARRCDRLEDGTEMFYLVMRDADLAGSETLAAELRVGEKRIVDLGGHDGYGHQIEHLHDGEWTTLKKQSVFIQDCW